MSAVVPCAPAEAARRAAWWREYSTLPGMDAEKVRECVARAEAYEAQVGGR